jgi:ABC-type lipoprotein export system ATPase subunit
VTLRKARGRTLVLVTHDPELAAMADEIFVMRDGRIVERREKAA